MKNRVYVLTFLLSLSFLFSSFSLFAQKFQWLTGGGSTDFLQNGAIKGEWITDMCTDDNGNVYATALVGDYNILADTFARNQSKNPTSGASWNVLFFSYDCNGTMRFAKLFEAKTSCSSFDLIYSRGSVYITGAQYQGKVYFGDDAYYNRQHSSAFLVKYDTAGNYDWVRFAGPDNLTTEFSVYGRGSASVDASGDVHHFVCIDDSCEFVSGTIYPYGNYDLKYDVSGNLLYVKKLQGVDSNYFIERVEIDKTTNKYYGLFEYRGGTITRSGSFLAAFNANGTQIWKDTTNPRAGFLNFTLSQGAVYFNGSATQTWPFTLKSTTINNAISTTGRTAVIGKINISTGSPEWMYHVDAINTVGGFADIAILPDNSIATFGHYGGLNQYNSDTIGSPLGANYRPMIFVIDTTGALIDWTWMYGTDFYNWGKVITSDNKGNIYFSGEVAGDLQAGNLPSYMKNGGNSDYYIGKFGYDCNCATLANPTSGFSITIKDSLKHEVEFTFTGTIPNDSVVWRFGDGSMLTHNNPTHTFADSGYYTVCAKVMVPCGRKVYCRNIYVPTKDTTSDTTNSIIAVNGLENIKIYPNPAKDVLKVSGMTTATDITIYDIVGRKVYADQTKETDHTINISQLPQGHYIIKLKDKEDRRAVSKFLKE